MPYLYVSLFMLWRLFTCSGYDFTVRLLLSRASLKPHVCVADICGKPVCKNGGTVVQRLRHKASQHKFLIQLLHVCAWTLHANAQHLHEITMQMMPGDVAQKVIPSLLLAVSVGGIVGDVHGLCSPHLISFKGLFTCDCLGGLLFCSPV